MLEIRNLEFAYSRNGPLVLSGLNLALEKGEIGVVLGANGAGKSTLFKTLLGIEKPLSGSITMDSVSITGMTARERAKHIAYVPQNVVFGDLSVFDTVLTGRIAHFGYKAGKEDWEAANRVIREMGLEDFRERSADRLSGGEKQKVAIARALAGSPALIVFDERTGNLDLANERLLIEETRRLARERGISVLCSLHDMNQALELGDRFFFLKEGQIRYTGGKEIFTEHVIEDIFGVKVKIIEAENQTVVIGG